MDTNIDLIIGHFDAIERGRFFTGWALNKNSEKHCRVTVLTSEGRKIASGLAQYVRPDLASLGCGRNDFAFRIPVTLPPGIEELRVFADEAELCGSPLRIGFGQFDGFVTVQDGVVKGEICERIIGGLPPQIRVQDQFGRIVAEGSATYSQESKTDAPTIYRIDIPLRADCFGFEELSLSAFANGESFANATAFASLRGYLDYAGYDRVAGWLLSPDSPQHRFEIDILCEGIRIGRGVCDRQRPDLQESFPRNMDSGFDIAIEWPSHLRGKSSLLSLRLSGSSTELFDGPFLLSQRADVVGATRNAAVRVREDGRFSDVERFAVERALAEMILKQRSGPAVLCERLPSWRGSLAHDRRMNVIVPIYRGVDITKACIESVLATRDASRDALVLINDCSPEASMSSMLNGFEHLPNVFVLHNSENLGFVRTVNRGLNFCRAGHCVLLNSDTCVFAGIWDEFDKILNENQSVGTVTPLSNNATIYSYPHPTRARSEPLEDVTWQELAAEALVRNSGLILDVPSGHGFCMVVRRQVLDQIGHLDVRFGRGYGEENDFCQRAADLGWRNVGACGVLVEHRESVSFQGEKAKLLSENLKLLNSIYPEYMPIVMEYEKSDPLRVARWPLDALRLRKMREAGGGFALVIRHSLGGGTDIAINDLERAHGYEGRMRLTLTFREDGRRELTCEAMNLIALFSPCDNARFFELLNDAGVDLVLIHQLLGADEAFVGDLTAWARERPGVRMVFHVHDFYALCPRVTMFSAAGHFCGASDSETCVRCVEMGGAHPASRTSVSPGEHRKIFAELMRACEAVIPPSKDTMTWMQRIFVDQAMVARAHPNANKSFSKESRRGDPNQIIIFGALGKEKGSRRLLKLARDARLNYPDLIFHVIGYTDIDDELIEIGNVNITGKYKHDEQGVMVQRVNGVVSLFLHEWPETFSYTLSEAWSFGLWPIVPDLGAPAARVREQGFGTVLSEITVDAIDSELRRSPWLNWSAERSPPGSELGQLAMAMKHPNRAHLPRSKIVGPPSLSEAI